MLDRHNEVIEVDLSLVFILSEDGKLELAIEQWTGFSLLCCLFFASPIVFGFPQERLIKQRLHITALLVGIQYYITKGLQWRC